MDGLLHGDVDALDEIKRQIDRLGFDDAVKDNIKNNFERLTKQAASDYDSAVDAHIALGMETWRKTLAWAKGEAQLSGFKYDGEIDWLKFDNMVWFTSDKLNLPLREHPFDPVVDSVTKEGYYYLSHSEKLLAYELLGLNDTMGITRPSCFDCREWLAAFSAYSDRLLTTADPKNIFMYINSGSDTGARLTLQWSPQRTPIAEILKQLVGQ